MNLFGLYVPGSTWLHRLAPGWKYLLLLALTVPALVAGDPLVSMAALVAAVVVLGTARAGWRRALGLPPALWVLLVVLAGYQILFGHAGLAVVVSANLVTAVYASRVLTLTTPGPVLIDALVAGLRPLRVLGLDPERAGLAVAIMVGSVPILLDTFDQVRQAARARGRERSLFTLITPVVVRAVGHAQARGAALAARGLGEPES